MILRHLRSEKNLAGVYKINWKANCLKGEVLRFFFAEGCLAWVYLFYFCWDDYLNVETFFQEEMDRIHCALREGDYLWRKELILGL